MGNNLSKTIRGDWEIRKELGRQLLNMRREKRYSLSYVSQQTREPVEQIDKIEIGNGWKISTFKRLCTFYGKKLKVGLEDL